MLNKFIIIFFCYHSNFWFGVFISLLYELHFSIFAHIVSNLVSVFLYFFLLLHFIKFCAWVGKTLFVLSLLEQPTGIPVHPIDLYIHLYRLLFDRFGEVIKSVNSGAKIANPKVLPCAATWRFAFSNLSDYFNLIFFVFGLYFLF